MKCPYESVINGFLVASLINLISANLVIAVPITPLKVLPNKPDTGFDKGEIQVWDVKTSKMRPAEKDDNIPWDAVKKSKNFWLEDVLFHLPKAEVAWADYNAIRRDFEFLAHDYITNDEIDHWLVENAAFISGRQIEGDNGMNDFTYADRENSRIGYRPPSYARAAVIPVHDLYKQKAEGLLDVKGVGLGYYFNRKKGENCLVRKAFKIDHGSGVGTLGEFIRETIFERLTNQIFTFSGYKREVVETYAVLSAGFNVITASGKKEPAGLYVRQAHIRPTPFTEKFIWEGNSFIPKGDREKIANVLELYGVTARKFPFEKDYENTTDIDAVNIQGTLGEKPAIYDFGHYNTYDISKETTYNTSGFKYFIQKASIPYKIWGYQGEDKRDGFNYSLTDNISIWSNLTAEAFVKNRERVSVRQGYLRQHFRNLLHDSYVIISSNPIPDEILKKLGL